MFNWLRTWRNRSKDGGKSAHVLAPVEPQIGSVLDTPEVLNASLVPWQSVFRDLLFDRGESTTDRPQLTETEAEKQVRQHVGAIILSPSSAAALVPRLPAILPRVMQSLRSEDSSSKDIADQIRRDPTLVAEVVRLANSPYYRTRQQITSLEHATFILGQNGLRELVMNVAFKPVFSSRNGRFSNHARPIVWDQAERCAAAAKQFASEFGCDGFEAYVVGLVHNIGITVVMKSMDDNYGSCTSPPAAQFCDDLLGRAQRLSSMIVQAWQFPADVILAMEAQMSEGSSAPTSPLARTLWMANRLSTIHLLVKHGKIDATECSLEHYFPPDLVPVSERCFAILDSFDQPHHRN